MDLVSVFATVILVTTVGTLVMAVAAYFAYKVREWRKPKISAAAIHEEEIAQGPVFLKRYLPPGHEQNPGHG